MKRLLALAAGIIVALAINVSGASANHGSGCYIQNPAPKPTISYFMSGPGTVKSRYGRVTYSLTNRCDNVVPKIGVYAVLEGTGYREWILDVASKEVYYQRSVAIYDSSTVLYCPTTYSVDPMVVTVSGYGWFWAGVHQGSSQGIRNESAPLIVYCIRP